MKNSPAGSVYGGGGITYMRWTDRLTIFPAMNTSAGMRIYVIYCPDANATITRYANNTNVTASLTVAADGIPLQDWARCGMSCQFRALLRIACRQTS